MIAWESILEVWGHANPKTRREESGGVRGEGWGGVGVGRERGIEGERERANARRRVSPWESTLAPPFIGLSQECCLFCLFCLKSSLWSSDLPCLLATAILDFFSLFYLPNTSKYDFKGEWQLQGWGASLSLSPHKAYTAHQSPCLSNYMETLNSSEPNTSNNTATNWNWHLS